MKIIRWLAIIVGSLIALILIAGIALYVTGSSRVDQTFDVEPSQIAIPTDSASIARGAYLANAICIECHGASLEGELMFAEDGIASVYAPNITPSDEGIASFSDTDLVRAIRHGVSPEGRPYMIMPSEVFVKWSEEDLAATVAYLKSLPPDDTPSGPVELGPMGMILLGAGMFGDVFAAEYIDHVTPPRPRPEIGTTLEYGKYFVGAAACTMCHGDDLMGGDPPRGIPEMGPVPPMLAAGGWTRDQFLTAVTTGVKPSGDTLDSTWMSVDIFARFDDEELAAIHVLLQDLLEQN